MSVSARFAALVVCLSALSPALAADPDAASAATPAAPGAPAAATAATAAPTDTPAVAADQDADQVASDAPKPTPQGLEFRRVTPIEPIEWSTPDAHYRWLLSRINDGTADARVMRQHYWAKQRLVPFTAPIPSGWREAAWARMTAPRVAVPRPAGETQPMAPDSAAAATAVPATGRWVNVGPTTIPGRVTGLARPARRPNELLAAMADGGLWRSRDNGLTWQQLTRREPTQASGAVAVDPRDPDRFYWGTGEGNGAIDNYGGISVARTSDGGRTWQYSNHFSGSFRGLTVNPYNPAEIWAAGDRLFRSTDGGANFARVFGGSPENGPVTVLFHPSNPQLVFATFWGPGLYRSADGGATWAPEGGGLPTGIGRSDVALCPSNPEVMVVAAESGGGDVWRTVNGGQNWTQLPAPDFCGGQCWYDLVVSIAPDDCSTIYLGGVDAFTSRDGGTTWTSVGAAGSSVHVDHHAQFAAPGGEIVMGSDGGVFRSVDYGRTFQNIGLGLPTTQYYGACGSDVEDGTLAGGTQDNGTHRHRNADGWAWVLGGDGGMCAIGGPKYLGEYQVTNLQRSTNGGANWEDANGGIDRNDRKAWVGIIEKDPQNADTLYVGTNQVYRTTNFHNTAWVRILGPIFYSRIVTALGVSPVDRNVLWVGHEYGGLYRSANALAPTPTFSNVRQNLPNRSIRRVQPHPGDAASAWVVISGYGNPRIMFTNNAGASYADRTGDLPDVPVNDLVIDPGDTNVLLAATDLGVFRTDDGGAHWYGFSDGLPSVAVIELFRHPKDGGIIAGTHGLSMFRLREASTGAVAVPDGATVAGRALRAERTASGDLWLQWDTERCTAERYNLFYGPLSSVAQGTYSGAACDLSRGGEAVIAMPGAAGQSQFFVVAGANAAGTEGPHGFTSSGAPRTNSGVGFCGVTTHVGAASCP